MCRLKYVMRIIENKVLENLIPYYAAERLNDLKCEVLLVDRKRLSK